MSDLTQLRDHAVFMGGREHVAGCPPVRSEPQRAHTASSEKWCGREIAHAEHSWTQSSAFTGDALAWHCRGICGGCLPDSERALWVSIAEEISAYLGRGDEGQSDLFGEVG